ncbi:disulfide bond formation protein B [Chitinimonas lacunae]|uniref:Disulfide bond formation protein B n=1 Tax=Chitinimonas lacunae TaxID=1963018 RepID=A0ABV8MNZ9_9NEIS
MNWIGTRRAVFFLIALACAGMMGFALYLEHYKYLPPCPLCMLQRAAVIGTGAVALLAALHDPAGRLGGRIYGVLAAVPALLGVAVAGRHVYIQSQPVGSFGSCGTTLQHMLDTMPLLATLKRVLLTSGECAIVDWSLFGISLPGWVLIGCIGLALAALWAGFFARRPGGRA